ncbi:MAG: hypothetical protein ACRC2R_18650 [Xenococcaceae cyanobacterium]
MKQLYQHRQGILALDSLSKLIDSKRSYQINNAIGLLAQRSDRNKQEIFEYTLENALITSLFEAIATDNAFETFDLSLYIFIFDRIRQK